MTRRSFFTITTVAIAFALAGTPNLSADPIKVLIVDGQNNHNWKDTTPFLKAQLEKTGKFTVDVSTTPEPNAGASEWEAWRPEFTKYDVVLSNFNNQGGSKWPEPVQKSFEEFIKNGGGLVNVHAANNAHNGWAEFEKMTGLLWRGAGGGFRVAFNEEREKVKMDKGQGPGAGHGPQHVYEVTVIQEHPITKDMPKRWMHTQDELYHGQRGPADDMNILMTAFSAKNKGGTGMYEPMLWWIPYGKGKCVTNVLGHVGKGDTNMPAMKCVGFVTTVLRSCEWAATGEVTIPVPDNFPTADMTRKIDE